MIRPSLAALSLMLLAAPAFAQSSGAASSPATGQGTGVDQQLAAPDAATSSQTGKGDKGASNPSAAGSKATTTTSDIKIRPSGQVEAPNP